ncbi:hypothetical protein BS17DRAFT_803906 [Gyrodon lividus]|nr:hypothetical protein BS17DRAFT_803906 [Gyrodon lividus]
MPLIMIFTSFLRVEGTKIVGGEGKGVLHGAGLGGWMTYPGCEFQIREAATTAIGKEKSDFFDKVRILPVNYLHFEDGDNPCVLKIEGSHHLDRVIGAFAYKDNPWVAGYNPMNKLADPHGTGPVHFYDRVYEAIRAIDENHIFFFDGSTYSIDFFAFSGDAKERLSIYPLTIMIAVLQYAVYGFPASPAPYDRSPEQIKLMRDTYQRNRAWTDQLYARREYDGEETDNINECRFNVLQDQLDIYDKLSWSIWLYKDIFQGMAYVSRDTPYMNIFDKLLERKFRLAVDAWGTNDKHNGVARPSRTVLIAGGLSFERLDEIAASFKFESCVKQDGLNKVLTDHTAPCKN